MNPTSSLPAIAALAVAVATAFVLTKKFGEPVDHGRYTSIDGLRGYLAFFVFLHHSCIWYFYLKSGKWELPPSNLYTHFGQSSVALFFMITSFLFFSKILDNRKTGIDWIRLYISRLIRLAPLYFFVLSILLCIVFLLSNGTANEPTSKILKEIVKWASFTILGTPSINGIEQTWIIVAGVTWSLPFEWIFYFSLPVLALLVGAKPPLAFIAIGLLSLASVADNPSIHHLSFIGGIAAAFLVRSNLIRTLACRKTSSLIAVSILCVLVIYYPSARGIAQILLLTAFFTIITGGNTLFGALSSPISRKLGELAYSLYLLHGIVLFTVFNFIIDPSNSRGFSTSTHWATIIAITPILIGICFFTFELIERPAMGNVNRLTTFIRSIFASRVGSKI